MGGGASADGTLHALHRYRKRERTAVGRFKNQKRKRKYGQCGYVICLFYPCMWQFLLVNIVDIHEYILVNVNFN